MGVAEGSISSSGESDLSKWETDEPGSSGSGAYMDDIAVHSGTLIEHPPGAKARDPAGPLQTAGANSGLRAFLIGQVWPVETERVVLKIARENVVCVEEAFAGLVVHQA